MKVNITSRHFKASDSLQEYITGKLEELEKYHEDILHANVVLSFEKTTNSIKHCEILVKLRDTIVTAKESGDEYEKAVDSAMEKIDTQVYKYKDKLKDLKHNNDKEINKTI